MPFVSAELALLIADSFAHGIASVRRSGPMHPFVHLVHGDGRRELRRVAAQRVEDAIFGARDMLLASSGLAAAVLVYDAWVQHDGRQVDGLLLDAYQAGTPATLVLQQPYAWRGLLTRTAVPLRDPVVLEEGRAPLFSTGVTV